MKKDCDDTCEIHLDGNVAFDNECFVTQITENIPLLLNKNVVTILGKCLKCSESPIFTHHQRQIHPAISAEMRMTADNKNIVKVYL